MKILLSLLLVLQNNAWSQDAVSGSTEVNSPIPTETASPQEVTTVLQETNEADIVVEQQDPGLHSVEGDEDLLKITVFPPEEVVVEKEEELHPVGDEEIKDKIDAEKFGFSKNAQIVVFVPPVANVSEENFEKTFDPVFSQALNKKTFKFVYLKESQNEKKVEEILREEPVSLVIVPLIGKKIAVDEVIKVSTKMGVTTIGLTASTSLSSEEDFLFQMGSNLKEQIACALTQKNKKVGKIAVLYPAGDAGARQLKFIEEVAEENKITITHKQVFDPVQTTFKAEAKALAGFNSKQYSGELQKCEEKSNSEFKLRKCKEKAQKNLNPVSSFDGIFIFATAEQTRLIVPALHAENFATGKTKIGKSIRLFGTELWNTERLFKIQKRIDPDLANQFDGAVFCASTDVVLLDKPKKSFVAIEAVFYKALSELNRLIEKHGAAAQTKDEDGQKYFSEKLEKELNGRSFKIKAVPMTVRSQRIQKIK
jgi:hypothetical protein